MKGDPAQRLSKVPSAPKHLGEHARREWKRMAPVAVRLGTLTEADLRAFELLCEMLETEARARETLEFAGSYSVPTADGGQKPHPAVRIMETARNQAHRLLSDFGLTPRGRGQVSRAAEADNGGWDDGLLA